jgi:hypothetical protein
MTVDFNPNPTPFTETKHVRGPDGKFSDKPNTTPTPKTNLDKIDPVLATLNEHLDPALVQKVLQVSTNYAARDTYTPTLQRTLPRRSTQQAAAIRAYRKLFRRLNNYLRRPEGAPPNPALEELTTQIESTFAPIGQDLLLARHISPATYNKLFRSNAGDLFHNKGFTSASTNNNLAGDLGPYRVMLEVPKYVKGTMLEGILPGETDALMERDLEYRLLGAAENRAHARVRVKP